MLHELPIPSFLFFSSLPFLHTLLTALSVFDLLHFLLLKINIDICTQLLIIPLSSSLGTCASRTCIFRLVDKTSDS